MEQFNIGRTLTRTFGLLGSGFSSAGLFMLIVYLAFSALSWAIQPLMVAEMTEIVAESADPDSPMAALAIFTSFWYWFTILLSLAVSALTYAGGIYAYLEAAEGKVVSLGSCFAVGLVKLLPMFVLTILWMIAVAFGFLLLIVPGIILITLWVAAMPALVAENRGIVESFGRSSDLTSGSRWPVFAVLLILTVLIYAVMFAVLGGLVGGAMMGSSWDLQQMEDMSDPVTLIASGVLGWATGMAIAAMVTAIYLELILVKEGARTDTLTDVFG